MSNLAKARDKELVIQNLNDEILIYDLITNKAYCLNKTSAIIWQMCDGKTNASEIAERLSLKLKQKLDKDFVWLAIEQLKKEDLLENSEDIKIEFEGLSRRQVIRRLGLASAVVLPAISTLLAPTAAMAQSVCINPGGAAPNTLVGGCGAGVGQPPATQAGCAVTCQNIFKSSCASCATFATASPSIPEFFECRCA